MPIEKRHDQRIVLEQRNKCEMCELNGKKPIRVCCVLLVMLEETNATRSVVHQRHIKLLTLQKTEVK